MKTKTIDPWSVAAIGAMRNLVLYWRDFDPIKHDWSYRTAVAILRYGYTVAEVRAAVRAEIARLSARRRDPLLEEQIAPAHCGSQLEAWQQFESILEGLKGSFRTVHKDWAAQQRYDDAVQREAARQRAKAEERSRVLDAIFAKRYTWLNRPAKTRLS